MVGAFLGPLNYGGAVITSITVPSFPFFASKLPQQSHAKGLIGNSPEPFFFIRGWCMTSTFL